LGVGRAPVEWYLEQGVPLALGTDSLASCDSLSLWDEIAFARSWFAGRLSPPQLLTMATRNGAAALGLGSEMGELAANRGAHFQVLVPASLPPAAELDEFLCSPGRSAEVSALYLDGREVLQKS
jgi:cytosine/adenosine deaminase-related metal-dependent hydrolase